MSDEEDRPATADQQVLPSRRDVLRQGATLGALTGLAWAAPQIVSAAPARATGTEDDSCPPGKPDGDPFDPFARLRGFGVFVRGDAVFENTSGIEHAIAVGGDLTLGRRQMDLVTSSSAAPGAGGLGLVVGGALRFTADGTSRVLHGGVRIGNANGAVARRRNQQTRIFAADPGGNLDARPHLELMQPNLDLAQIFGPSGIDFAGIFVDLAATSRALGYCLPNARVVGSTNPRLELDGDAGSARQVVLAVDASQLSSIGVLTLGYTPSRDLPLVINVRGNGHVSWTPTELSPASRQLGRYVIWNFPDATSVAIAAQPSRQVHGTILAPNAEVTNRNQANLVGSVIARGFTQGGFESGTNAGQMHREPFDTKVRGCCPPGPR